MKKRILSVLILLILCASCSMQKSVVDISKDNQEFTLLNKATMVDDLIYYVNPLDDRLYVVDEGLSKHEIVSDEDVDLFAIAEQRMVLLDTEGRLAVNDPHDQLRKTIDWHASEHMRPPMGFGYSPQGYSILYEEAIAYLNDNELIIIDYNGQEITHPSEQETLLLAPYSGNVIYTTKNDGLFDSNMLKIVKANGKENMDIFSGYFFSIQVYQDWIYYIDEYSIYRYSIIDGNKDLVIRDTGIFRFVVTNGKVICSRKDDVVISELDGANIEVIAKGSNNYLLNAKGDIVIYEARADGYVGIYDIEDKTLRKIETKKACRNCVMLGDLIYMVFEDNNGGLYTLDGQQVYSFTQE